MIQIAGGIILAFVAFPILVWLAFQIIRALFWILILPLEIAWLIADEFKRKS